MSNARCPYWLTELAREGGPPLQCVLAAGHEGEHFYGLTYRAQRAPERPHHRRRVTFAGSIAPRNEGGGHMSTGGPDIPQQQPIAVDEAALEQLRTGEPLGTSILDDIRAIREARIVADQPRLVTNIPQYEERLAIIHHFPEGGAERLLDAVNAETSATSYDQRIEAACKQLMQTCAAIVVRNPEGKLCDPDTGALLGPDEKPELPGRPMLFDRRCADVFKIEIPPEVKGVGVFVCRNLFSPRGQSHTVYDGDIALINTSNGVYAWLNGARLAADEDAAGE